MNGRLQNVQIFDTALSASEVAALVPEPSTLAGCVVALGSLGMYRLHRRMRHRRGRWRELLVAAATLLTLVGSRVPAADLTWDPGGAGGGTGGTGTWNTTGPFWNDAGTFRAWSNVLLDVGIFGGTAGTVTLGESITASGLQFTATGYTVTGNTLTLSGGTPSITTSAGVTATIQSRLVGTAGLFISGAGTVLLQPSGATAETANTYSGGTVVSSGTLELSGGNSGFSVVGAGPLTIQAGATARALSDNALGNGNVVNLTPLVIDGGTFEADAYNHINSITMTGGLLGIRSGVTQVDGMDMRVRNSVDPTITTNASASTATISSKVRNRGPLTITVADGLATIDLTMAGTISGNQAVTKSGLGTLSWTAANDLTGAVNVTGGTLLINANQSAATGAVTVAAAGRLGGTGTIGGATAISGILAPGNGGIGTLSVANDVTWNGGQNWLFELGAAGASIGSPGTSDLLSITGVNEFIKGTGSSWTFDFGGTGEQGWYRLAEWTGGSTGFVATDFTATGLSGANTGEFFIENSALYIKVVPEPATWALAALGLACGSWGLRRRRRIRRAA